MRILGIFAIVLAVSLAGCKKKSTDSAVKGVGGSIANPMTELFDHLATKKVPGQNESIYTDAHIRGLKIWFLATGGNERYHTYPYIQRTGVAFDFNQVLGPNPKSGKHTRVDRFDRYGVINDPACRAPVGDEVNWNFGWDICPGDKEMVKFVGNPDLNWNKFDPACNEESAQRAGIGHALPDTGGNGNPIGTGKLANVELESACYLRFGQSTGVMGLRKFPNPRFDKEEWAQIGGWEGYDYKNASIEPPFMVGTSCLFCHVSLHPENPPKNPNEPGWTNLLGTTGPTYTHVTKLQLSGMHGGYHAEKQTIARKRQAGITGVDKIESDEGRRSFQYQAFAGPSRPGGTDTSGVPNDMVSNYGVANRIMNFLRRPPFRSTNFDFNVTDTNRPFGYNLLSVDEAKKLGRNIAKEDSADDATMDKFFGRNMEKWFRVEKCSGDKCQKVTNTRGKVAYWEKQKQRQIVQNILKGGEDDVGPELAVQRVYINIGTCAETCWMNHHNEISVLEGRGKYLSPMDYGQCREQCPSWRAIEDRIYDVINFLVVGPTTDLHNAKLDSAGSEKKTIAPDRKSLVETLGSDQVKHGAEIFSRECAKCHSSGGEKTQNLDGGKALAMFHEIDSATGMRVDYMGNERRIPVEEIKTFPCRAAHSNHSTGQIWEESGSDTYRTWGENGLGHPTITAQAMPEFYSMPGEKPEGRGFYRNVSLLSIWAFAPFLHNNSLGPEMCGSEYADVQGPTDRLISQDQGWWDKNASGKVIRCHNYKDALPKFPRDTYLTNSDNSPMFPGNYKLYSTEGRLWMFEQSFRRLMSPENKRPFKVTETKFPISVDLIPDPAKLAKNFLAILGHGFSPEKLSYLSLGLPPGIAAHYLGSVDIKRLAGLIVNKYMSGDASKKSPNQIFQAMSKFSIALKAMQGNRTEQIKFVEDLLVQFDGQIVTNCGKGINGESNRSKIRENQGHTIGVEMPGKDKRDLFKFLLTL